MTIAETSSSKPKKRKDRPTSETPELVRKKSKLGRSPADQSADVSLSRKGKERAFVEDSKEFSVVGATVRVTIPPVFASDPEAGVEEMLDSMVMKYNPSLEGVVLAHHNLEFLDSTAQILNDCPYMVCSVSFDATIWCPRIGSELVGKVNLFSPDHVALLCHRTFNVSIPRKHIPTDEYEYEHGPAENDPEFGAGSSAWRDRRAVEHDASQPEDGNQADSVGRWIRRTTGSTMGGTSGELRFTVIGFTLANQMLSLVGSLQLDPFDPKYSEPDAASKPAEAPDAMRNGAETHDEQPRKKRKKVTIIEDGAEVPKKKRRKKDSKIESVS